MGVLLNSNTADNGYLRQTGSVPNVATTSYTISMWIKTSGNPLNSTILSTAPNFGVANDMGIRVQAVSGGFTMVTRSSGSESGTVTINTPSWPSGFSDWELMVARFTINASEQISFRSLVVNDNTPDTDVVAINQSDVQNAIHLNAAFSTVAFAITKQVWYAEFGMWNKLLSDDEVVELLTYQPNAVSTGNLLLYTPFSSDATSTYPASGSDWSELGDFADSSSYNAGTHPSLLPPEEPEIPEETNVSVIVISYPIQQSGFNQNSVDETIVDYRATRLSVSSSNSSATKTQWEINIGGDNFYITTTSNTSATGSVLAGTVSYLDYWFPPAHTGTVKYRQYVDGSWGAWSSVVAFTSLGYINSYEKYQILNRNTTTVS